MDDRNVNTTLQRRQNSVELDGKMRSMVIRTLNKNFAHKRHQCLREIGLNGENKSVEQSVAERTLHEMNASNDRSTAPNSADCSLTENVSATTPATIFCNQKSNEIGCAHSSAKKHKLSHPIGIGCTGF
jgi:hypothetical protein